MAGKKKAKASAMKASKSECACCSKSELEAKLPVGLLILIGALGLAQAMGYLNGWVAFEELFPYVWSVLVLVIGFKMGMDLSNCKC